MSKLKNAKIISIIALSSAVVGCSGLFDTDNTPKPSPLAAFKQEISPRLLYSTNTGNGANKDHLKMSPTVNENTIYTASADGKVTAVDRKSGTIRWQVNTNTALTTGPGVGNGIVIVGGDHGEIIARNSLDGSKAWERKVLGAVMTNPVVVGNRVIIKSLDGHLYALSAKNGRRLWSTQQAEPNLILRGASRPVVTNGKIIAGFANGHLNQYKLSNGSIGWNKALATPEGAFAIERMIDIDADPKLFQGQLFAATYQGRVAKLSPSSGRTSWSHKLSSYTGMDTDGSNLYISDAQGNVWSFSNDKGKVNWRQNVLKARGVSGPAVLGKYIVVGDAQGYLHWLDNRDGRIVARESLSGGVSASPVVKDGTLYVQTNSGNLYAYTLG